MRDNDDLIGAARRVPRPWEPAQFRFGTVFDNQAQQITAKSLILKYFTRNPFKPKDLAGISS